MKRRLQTYEPNPFFSFGERGEGLCLCEQKNPFYFLFSAMTLTETCLLCPANNAVKVYRESI